jgi:hypothetical protein
MWSFLLAFVMSLLGFSFLALSQARHWQRVACRPTVTVLMAPLYRAMGGLLLFIALTIVWGTEGPSFGALITAMTFTFSAVAIAFGLAWKPGWFRWLIAFGD